MCELVARLGAGQARHRRRRRVGAARRRCRASPCCAAPPTAGPAAARNLGLAAVTTPARGLRRRRLPARAGLAGAAPAPLRRRPRRRRRPPGRQPRAARRRSVLARYESVRSPARPRPDRGPGAGRHPDLLRARRRARRPCRRAPGRRRLRRGPALGEDVDLVWRLDESGLRVRYEPAGVVAPRAPPHAAGVAGPAGVVRPLGRRPRRAPPGRRAARSPSAAGARRCGRWPPPAPRSPALATAGGTALALSRQAAEPRRSRAGRRCGSPGTGHLFAGRMLAERHHPGMVAGRRSPSLSCRGGPGGCWPPPPSSPRCSTGSASGRRSTPCATSRCACSTTPPTASGCGRAPSSAAPPTRSCPTSPRGPGRRATTATARRDDPHPPRRRRRLAGRRPSHRRGPRRRDRRGEGQRLRVRAAPPGRRGPGPRPATRLAVGTVHELAGLPPTRRAADRAHARPSAPTSPSGRGAVLTVGSIAHVAAPPPAAGAPVDGEAGVVDAPLRRRSRRARRAAGRRRRRRADRATASRLHLPLAGDAGRRGRGVAGSAARRGRRLAVSHVDAAALHDLPRPPPRPSACRSGSAPLCGTATRSRWRCGPTWSRCARRRRRPPATGGATCPERRHPRDGGRRHRPRRAPAARRPQPVPLRPPAPGARRAAPHAHLDGVGAARAARARRSATRSTCRCR